MHLLDTGSGSCYAVAIQNLAASAALVLSELVTGSYCNLGSTSCSLLLTMTHDSQLCSVSCQSSCFSNGH